MFNRLLNRLPLTIIKIKIAAILYRLVKIFVWNDHQIITRQKIRYAVDLKEGLDLSLFLFGSFQKHVTHSALYKIPADATIIDIGANVGLMSLQFAQMAPQGKVYAFEPTDYAFGKLQKNLSLNPDLAQRIVVYKSFVSNQEQEKAEIVAYSSWQVAGANSHDKHPVHLGSAMEASDTGSTTLDAFVKEKQLNRIDFLKIDTDGHEFEVFGGAQATIKQFQPVIVFEIGQYVMQEKGIDFSFYYQYLSPLGYKLYDSKSEKAITLTNYQDIIPRKGTIDIIAIPAAKS
ncbi:FkbM family methyltransferase [Cytophagales bacterium LB-30]|uniref:FkbM family methyltransferase n=1 Tax=Shiella aurantiaca TaxID=3058365 RepID=A0ABT8F5E6_9BACT|nr:FkbM family methyltransferase [Shiella aurantiaca]MDN4165446.1 FkbM family methyltransferase [Shiella aurantiaca]